MDQVLAALAQGARPNGRNEHQCTPLHATSCLQTACALVGHGARLGEPKLATLSTIRPHSTVRALLAVIQPLPPTPLDLTCIYGQPAAHFFYHASDKAVLITAQVSACVYVGARACVNGCVCLLYIGNPIPSVF